jgi:hypothetical protein
MFEIHLDVQTPPDDTILWRYMDLSKALVLVRTAALYFALPRELGDPWEGAHTEKTATALKDKLGGEEYKRLRSLYALAATDVVVNCWHANTHESVAMWKLYTSCGDGVAIQTTVRRLKKAVEREPFPIHMGSVQYLDYERDTIDGFNTLSPLLCKRKSFAHECEVRAFIPFPAARQLEVMARTQHVQLGMTVAVPRLQQGISIGVDLKELVQRVVVSPTYPSWSLGVLNDILRSSGLEVEAETSDLLKQPV